jgi:hypothetical protein
MTIRLLRFTLMRPRIIMSRPIARELAKQDWPGYDTYKMTLVNDTDVLTPCSITQRTPQTMRVFVERTVANDIARRMLPELQTQPGPPRYPIRWRSVRQRRAFFATDGFGRGIPTVRSGKMVSAWRITPRSVQDGGVIEVSNDVPYARYVIGDDQQPYHADTGWRLADDIVLKYSVIAQDMLIDGWFSISNIGKGIRLP